MPRPTALPTLGALVLALVAPAGAQVLNATISPNPALPGQTVQLSISDVFGLQSVLPSGCSLNSVTRDGPAGVGTPVLQPIGCGAVPLAVPACSSGNVLTGAWLPITASGLTVPPGRYWFNVRFFLPTSPTLRTESFPFTINATAADATLGEIAPPLVGSQFGMQVSSPADAGNAYFCATSATTNAGIPVGSVRSGLDPDALFFLSFPSPLPGVFVNFQGTLDAAGNSPPIGINLPNLPALQCLPLHVEAAILPAGGGQPRLTNTLHAVIQ